MKQAKIVKPKLITFFFILFILLGVFLRFYRIGEWQYFNFDQARDYLIIKRIIVDHKLTLLGPTVLAPGVYLPPFYYYSLIPALVLSGFHIIGPDIFTAMMGIFSIYLIYVLIKDLWNTKVALLIALLFSANPYLIQASRHAWNPNTIYVFTLLFAISIYRYLFNKQRIYLVLSAFSLAWALNLHYTVLVLFPILFFVWCVDLIKYRINKILFLSIAFFIMLLSPLIAFDFRHNFSITKSVVNFTLANNEVQNTDVNRIKQGMIDFVKVPTIFLSGIYQKSNVTANPTNLILVDKLTLITGNNIEITAGVFGLILYLISVGFVITGLIKRDKKCLYIFVLLVAGFSIRLIFPPKSLYFYHYTYLFPFIFLPIAYALSVIFNAKHKLVIYSSYLVFAVVFVWSLVNQDLKNEVKPENYYLSAASTIAKDLPEGKKLAVAVNVYPFHWYRHGPEYRYFLETFYKLSLGGYEPSDYQNADLLYLIDEGNLKEPLKIGGLEMDSFKGTTIEKTINSEYGQRIYRIGKQ